MATQPYKLSEIPINNKKKIRKGGGILSSIDHSLRVMSLIGGVNLIGTSPNESLLSNITPRIFKKKRIIKK